MLFHRDSISLVWKAYWGVQENKRCPVPPHGYRFIATWDTTSQSHKIPISTNPDSKVQVRGPGLSLPEVLKASSLMHRTTYPFTSEVQHFKWISENDDKKKDERAQDRDSYSDVLRSPAEMQQRLAGRIFICCGSTRRRERR